jgi:hypothetical protein
MQLLPGFDHTENAVEFLRQGCQRIATHGQAAAPFGSVEVEGGDDGHTAGREGGAQRLPVPCTIPLLHKKMEAGSIVPQRELSGRVPLGHVRNQVLNARPFA